MNEDRMSVCSFVLRCTPCESPSGWRIKVTHVQQQVELTMVSLDEAALYMKNMLERGQKHDGQAGGE
ncbi:MULTISPECIES: hypothetical protein [Paenibacillus]|uniref:Uncharacterized protein n=1 Tax=Paenibacillus azoreducens TaxID=116718 RepID=A0A920CU38_9BACL|nr:MULTISPECIES: hypothetical protein [Paenibacillus]MBE9914438.1 hypothetical protein [Paenibacillus donghaensis]GIO49078.1 hypothetical protein J34TS1_38430 [Paenibacillus azoreducens]